MDDTHQVGLYLDIEKTNCVRSKDNKQVEFVQTN